MPCPTPSTFQALIVDLDAPACDQLRKLGRLAETVSNAFSCIYNEDGTFTTEFAARICAAGCGGGGSSGSSTTPAGGSQSLVAVSDLTMPEVYQHFTQESFRMRFTKVIGATSYSVYRSLVNNFALATRVDDATPTVVLTDSWLVGGPKSVYDCGDYVFFSDPVSGPSASLNDLHYYWVRAHGAAGAISAASNVASGRRFRNYTYRSLSTFNNYLNTPATGVFTVDAGLSKLVFSLIGGGGGGGGGSITAAGGGGGGGATLIGEVDVVAGNQFYASFGTGGAAGATSANGGVGSYAAIHYRATSNDAWIEVARVLGAGGGVYNGAGGAGGAGSSSTIDAVYFKNVLRYDGSSGAAASGFNGGYTGADRFSRRWPQGENVVPSGGSYGSGNPGGGSDRALDPSGVQFAVGGAGGPAFSIGLGEVFA